MGRSLNDRDLEFFVQLGTMGQNNLIDDNWDVQLAGYPYEHIRDHCLFAVIWSERPQGGYNQSDFEPFIAMNKVENQGVQAYEGIHLGTTWNEYLDGTKIIRIRKVCVAARSYIPMSFLADTVRMTVVKNPDEILQLFLDRWKQ